MEIKEVVKTVFVGPDGAEFLTREEAERAAYAARLGACREWLSDELSSAGGAYYDFNIDLAAEWVLDNIDTIRERLLAHKAPESGVETDQT